MKRNALKPVLIAATSLFVLALCASFAQFDGADRFHNPQVAAVLPGSHKWLSRPALVEDESDPGAVYAVAPELSATGLHPAFRIDCGSGTVKAVNIPLGPKSPFRNFTIVEMRAKVRGLRIKRPAFHLMSLPDGKGPGMHLVDSASGTVDIMPAGSSRVLLSRVVFNSSEVDLLTESFFQDPGQKWTVALTRYPSGWKLSLFPNSAN